MFFQVAEVSSLQKLDQYKQKLDKSQDCILKYKNKKNLYTLLKYQTFSVFQAAAARWLGLRVRISPGEWMSVSRECCVLSCGVLCVRLIARPEESCQ
jgi:hypothetical protein